MDEEVILKWDDGTEEAATIQRKPDGTGWEYLRRQRPTQGDFKTEQWKRYPADSNEFMISESGGKAELTSVDYYELPQAERL